MFHVPCNWEKTKTLIYLLSNTEKPHPYILGVDQDRTILGHIGCITLANLRMLVIIVRHSNGNTTKFKIHVKGSLD
jgi:hypothetical protein